MFKLLTTHDALRTRKGFTLIEILVVVAIIGILASIVLVGLGGARRQGGDAKRIAELRQVQTGLELYFTKCGHYPGGASAGNCTSTNPTSWTQLQQALLGANLGINSVPNDPTAPTKEYLYAVRPDQQSYVLGAVLSADHSALKDDFDGSTAGWASTGTLNCDDAGATPFTYCITP